MQDSLKQQARKLAKETLEVKWKCGCAVCVLNKLHDKKNLIQYSKKQLKKVKENLLKSKIPIGWMYDHQLKAIEILNRKFELLDGQCLADDMGLGKTFTALALYMYKLKLNKIMVVCPSINIETWKEQFEQFNEFCNKN